MSIIRTRDHAARRLRPAAAALCGLILFGVQNAHAGTCHTRPSRPHWSHSRHVQFEYYRHSQPPRWDAGTIVVNGRCYTVSCTDPAADVLRILRRCGYRASLEHTCDGVRVCVDGCPRIQWRTGRTHARVTHRYNSVSIDFHIGW